MKTLYFIKDYMNMSDEALKDAHVHTGKVIVTSRVFEHIVGRNYADLHEFQTLQRAIDCYLEDAEMPADLLVRTEFGSGLSKLLEVDELNYLTQTPFSVMKIDFDNACADILEFYLELGGRQ